MGLIAVGLSSGGGNLEAWTQAPSKPAGCHLEPVGLSQSPIAQSAGPLQALASLRRRGLEYISGGDAWVKSWAGSVSLLRIHWGWPWHKANLHGVLAALKDLLILALHFSYATYGAGAYTCLLLRMEKADPRTGPVDCGWTS